MSRKTKDGKASKDTKTQRDMISDLLSSLENRARSIDTTRGHAVAPLDVYENGLYWGLMIAIGELKAKVKGNTK